MEFRFELDDGRLRPISLLPQGVSAEWKAEKPTPTSGAEVALQVTGRNWNEHHAKKLVGGSPGTELIYRGQRDEPSPGGHHTVLLLQADDPKLDVESHYQFFDGVPQPSPNSRRASQVGRSGWAIDSRGREWGRDG